ncbi:MAG TPA: hypothetical protein VFV75_20960 [Candidatus Polarisedimenticolaceae bacterium]|nr:hypothetical protein [Candidatus Polarisedimenticolaceae bacterium]
MHERAHRLGVALIILALVTLVGVAHAQTSTTSSTPSSTTSSWTTSAVTGTVMSVDPQAKSVTVKTDAGSTQAFLLSDPIWMRSAGKDISINELKVGDRVRIEPTPGAGTDEPTRTASRLEVLGAGSIQGSTGSTYGAESPSMETGTQPGSGSAMGATSSDRTGSAQRTVSTERPVLGESADAGEDRDAMPSSAGSTTGRTVSTDRPVLGQKPERDTATTGSTSSTTTTGSTTYGTSSTTGTTGSTGTYGSSTYGSSTTTPSSPATSSTASSTNTQTSADELPATASPLPMLGVLGLLALGAGFALRATRKQHS